MTSPSIRNVERAHTELTMLDLFAEQVRARPTTTAVSSGIVNITYAELDRRSDRIAAWLVKHNIGPEDIVAIEMERGHELIAALLGVLKAGAGYLALELGTPRSRRDRLVADAGARALITVPEEPERAGLLTLRLPEDLDRSLKVDPFHAKRVHPDGLAYVCYTSGSTGQPKGVAVPHRAVVRLVCGNYAESGPNQTYLFLSPVSFDASTFEIWAPLLTGGRVVIYPSGPLVAEELAAVLQQEKITTLFLTTALFHRMVEHNLDALGSLRQLLTGGESLNPAHFNRFIDRLPTTQLIAAYGPTENTTFTTCYPVPGPILTSFVPLGNPITDTTIHVLDSKLMPVPSGTTGELFTGGQGVSRGYLNHPAATALSFVPDPYGSPGSRMYRTGDLVRQEPTGDLEFIGRHDRQVKIRGFRVEPAEIEREMLLIPGVKEAIVVTHPGQLSEKRLTAYLVADPNGDHGEELAARVRRSLRSTLPPAMIPAAFITLTDFPLTPNGKIDLASLTSPERAARQADADFVEPRSPTELLLCDMWAEALKVDSVGVLDDFFELGGNSLLAMDLISRTETVFEVELPVRALLYHPTVEEFASAIDELIADGNQPA